MSTMTRARNRSTPNQWARSAINVYTDTSTTSINAKPMGTISYQCPARTHKQVFNQRQTNRRDNWLDPLILGIHGMGLRPEGVQGKLN